MSFLHISCMSSMFILYCPRVSWTSDLINRPRIVTQESGEER